MTLERVFIVGGTGNIGKKVVEDLVAKEIPVTLLARNPAKVNEMFPTAQVVEGDLNGDLEHLKSSLKDHTRLFILVSVFGRPMEQVKATVAKLAYEAGIKQIVDVSSLNASWPWRTSYIGDIHRNSEQAMMEIPQRGHLVSLRPGRFMSNVLTFDRLTPEGLFFDISDESQVQSWISPNDIGAIAANILSEDIEKHGDAVYELIGDAITISERVNIMSRILNKPVIYQKVRPLDKYNQFIKFQFPHRIAYDFSSLPVSIVPDGHVSSGMAILLGREPESFEQYIEKYKNLF